MDYFHHSFVFRANFCTTNQRLQYTPALDATSIFVAIWRIDTASHQTEDGTGVTLSVTIDTLYTRGQGEWQGSESRGHRS